MTLLIACLWAGIVAWLIARAARQYRAFRTLTPTLLATAAPAIDVVVPARNEASGIARCLAGLLAQDYPGRVRVTVVDDGSSDGTAALARGIAVGERRASIIEAGPLPIGWTGKTRACWCGAARGEAEWLCFVDADTMPEPPLLQSAVAAAQQGGYDLLSLAPRQHLVTPWERLIIPAGLCALGFAGDLRRLDKERSPVAAVNGQFLLVRRVIYRRAGGHAAVRGEIAEDGALAARVAACGGRLALMNAAPLIGVRMYRGLPALWEGLAKNVVETLGSAPMAGAVAALGLVLAWGAIAVPAALGVAALNAAWSPAALLALAIAVLASTALVALHVAAARYLDVPAWYGLLFPLGYTLAALLVADGIAQRRRGAVAWKGRRYAAPRRPASG